MTDRDALREALAEALQTVTRGSWSTPTRKDPDRQREQDERWLRDTADAILAHPAVLAALDKSEPAGLLCTCMPFFAGHVTQHPDCPLGRKEAAHPAAAKVRDKSEPAGLRENDCEHADERGSTVMETSIPHRYECAVCGQRFTLTPYPALAATPTASPPAPIIEAALDTLDVIDGIVDDTHPEGDGCPLCVALDDLRNVLERGARLVGPPPRAATPTASPTAAGERDTP